MKVLYVAAEVAPFIKTGGLADVAGALPAALNKQGVETRVMLPLYEAIGDVWRQKMKLTYQTYISLGWRKIYCGVFEMEHGGVTYYFLDNEYYFKRSKIYGHFDDGERFAFFSRAVAELLFQMDWIPDVVHLNDWQTGLVPIYMRDLSWQFHILGSIKTVFTIHNIEYQGRFSKEIVEDVCGLPRKWYDSGILEFMGSMSMMKGALLTSDYVTTVSPTYSDELKYSFYAHGLEGVISHISGKFRGILNGIDMDSYNPGTDPRIYQNFTVNSLEDRAKNKEELQKLLNLIPNPNAPIIACIGRLTAHKGMDLVLSTLNSIMGMDVQFVVLGTGDYNYEQFFLLAQNHYANRFSANITFSEELARRIYAGADLFLMPSQKEPCGLSQMIAMRYGAIPIVRKTGGLRDTVMPYNPENGEGRGFAFDNYNAGDMLETIRQAVDLYFNRKDHLNSMIRRNMGIDFSWENSAGQTKRLYEEITGKK